MGRNTTNNRSVDHHESAADLCLNQSGMQNESRRCSVELQKSQVSADYQYADLISKPHHNGQRQQPNYQQQPLLSALSSVC